MTNGGQITVFGRGRRKTRGSTSERDRRAALDALQAPEVPNLSLPKGGQPQPNAGYADRPGMQLTAPASTLNVSPHWMRHSHASMRLIGYADSPGRRNARPFEYCDYRAVPSPRGE